MSRFMSLGLAGLLSLVLSNVANAQALEGRIPNSFVFYDSCNDEYVAVDIVIHVVTTPQGTTINNVKGTAVGLSSGTPYEWNGTSKIESFEIWEGNTLTSLTTGTGRSRLISHGGNPDLLLTTHFEFGSVITFDPVTGFPIDFQFFDNSVDVIDCRGAHQ